MAVALLAATGCSTCRLARRTTLDEPAEYSTYKDQQRSLRQYRLWADRAWAEYAAACPPESNSESYAGGFRDGFVDYIYAGGAGEPPPVPPRSFSNLPWRGAAGQRAVDNWFAGYRLGARTARDGGYRQFGIVPSSVWCEVPAGVSITGPATSAINALPGESLNPELIPAPQPASPAESPLPRPAQLDPAPREAPPPESPAKDALHLAPPDRTAASEADDFPAALRSAATRGAARSAAPHR